MLPLLSDAAAAVRRCPGRAPDLLVLDLLANAGLCTARWLLDEAALRLCRSVELCVSRRLTARC